MIDMKQNAIGTVDDLIKSMKISVGLEQAPEQLKDPFAVEAQNSPATESKPLADWMPDKQAELADTKLKEQEFVDSLLQDPIFKKVVAELDSYLEAVGQEVLNPETPYSPQDAEVDLTKFIQEQINKEAFDG